MVNDEVWALVGRQVEGAALAADAAGNPTVLVLTWADADPTALAAVAGRLEVEPAPGEPATGAGADHVAAAVQALVGQTVRGLGSQTDDAGALTGLDLVLDENVLSVRAHPNGLTVEVTERVRRRRG